MNAASRQVRPNNRPVSELRARELLSPALVKLSTAEGPRDAAGVMRCDEKTFRNARDEKSTLRLDLAFNALLADPHALDGLLGHFGRRSVATDAVCDTDDRAKGSSLLKAALELSVALEDGKIDDRELARALPFLREAYEATAALLSRHELKSVA